MCFFVFSTNLALCFFGFRPISRCDILCLGQCRDVFVCLDQYRVVNLGCLDVCWGGGVGAKQGAQLEVGVKHPMTQPWLTAWRSGPGLNTILTIILTLPGRAPHLIQSSLLSSHSYFLIAHINLILSLTLLSLRFYRPLCVYCTPGWARDSNHSVPPCPCVACKCALHGIPCRG